MQLAISQAIYGELDYSYAIIKQGRTNDTAEL
jgi:hypothetical protein